MGRRRTTDTEKLASRVHTYLTASEYADLRARAARAGRSVAGFTRDILIGVLNAERQYQTKEGEAHG